MTRIFVRARRQGRWTYVEFDQLTDAELQAFGKHSSELGWNYAIALAKWIRYHVNVVPDPNHDEPSDGLYVLAGGVLKRMAMAPTQPDSTDLNIEIDDPDEGN